MKNTMVSRRKEIVKIDAKINAKETKETIAKINKAKSWFFERINKIDKPLAREAISLRYACCRKGDPLPGPKTGLLSNTRKIIVQGDTC